MKVIDSFTMRPMSCIFAASTRWRVASVRRRLCVAHADARIICGNGGTFVATWTIASLPATAVFTASPSNRSTATGSAPCARSCADASSRRETARTSWPAPTSRSTVGGPITPVAPVMNTCTPTPPRSPHRLLDPLHADLERLRRRPLDRTDHQVGQGHGPQLGPPRRVRAVHRRVDAAHPPVLTRRARGRAPAADLGAPERGLVAVDRLHHLEHGDL